MRLKLNESGSFQLNEETYDEFFEKALKMFAKKFKKEADINAFDKEEKKAFFEYVDAQWKGDKEKEKEED